MPRQWTFLANSLAAAGNADVPGSNLGWFYGRFTFSKFASRPSARNTSAFS